MNRRAFLQSTAAGAAALALPATIRAQAQRPNIVFVLADDLGWTDLGCCGSRYHETPNLDKLAARALRLTQAYAASPLCSPTRSSIMAGQWPARIGITAPACHVPEVQLEKRLQPTGPPDAPALQAASLTRLKSEYVTLAETLKAAGYATAHFGKWHLGHNLASRPGDRYEPRDQGFDLDFPHTPAATGPGGGYLAPWKFVRDPAIKGEPGQHIEDRMSAEAARFIAAHRDQPFFINYWAYSVHSPWSARPDYVAHFKAKADPANPQHNPVYAAMVKSLDDAVGHLVAAVEQAGVGQRTILVFFSDNGGYSYPVPSTDPEGWAEVPATSNLPLRAGKASLYEGGTREPCLVRWPGRTRPGAVSDALLSSVDWYPTLLAMAGVKPLPDTKLDGLDQSPMLAGGAPVRDTVYCHFPHGSPRAAEKIDGFLPGSYVRRGDWKLIRFHAANPDGSDKLELYNLRDDLGEKTNLAAREPIRVAELGQLLAAWLKDTEAVVPTRNPAYGRPEKPADPLLGFKARGCDAEVKGGILTAKGTGPSPFLGVGAGVKGPATVVYRIRCAAGGEGRVEWLPSTTKPDAAKSVRYVLPPGEWQELTVKIDEPGEIGILRFYLPSKDQPVSLDWVQLKAAGGNRRWDF
jgi:arylsulfatase A-like enzyme